MKIPKRNSGKRIQNTKKRSENLPGALGTYFALNVLSFRAGKDSYLNPKTATDG